MGGLMSMFAPVWEKLMGKDEFRIIMVGLDVSSMFWLLLFWWATYIPQMYATNFHSSHFNASLLILLLTYAYAYASFLSVLGRRENHSAVSSEIGWSPGRLAVVWLLLMNLYAQGGAGTIACSHNLNLFCRRSQNTVPTIGFNVETVEYNNISFTVWVGSLWFDFYLWTYLICTRRCWYHSLFSQLELVLSSVAGCRWSRKGRLVGLTFTYELIQKEVLVWYRTIACSHDLFCRRSLLTSLSIPYIAESSMASLFGWSSCTHLCRRFEWSRTYPCRQGRTRSTIEQWRIEDGMYFGTRQ